MTGPRIDLISAEAFGQGQPHDQFRWLRENDPVFWHEEPSGPGFWALTRYDDVCAVGRDAKTFSSSAGGVVVFDVPPEGLPFLRNNPLVMDPPQHTRYRGMVSDQFTLRAARMRQPRMEEFAHQIVDRVIDRGECDLVTEIADELPAHVVAELMGVPLEDCRSIARWSEKILSPDELVPQSEKTRLSIEMLQYAGSMTEEKRKHLGDDVGTRLLGAEIDGRRLTSEELTFFFSLLIDAGGSTTRSLLAGGMLTLFENPEQRHRLQSDLDRFLPTAVEEMLRYVSPVVHFRRTATCDTELAGKRIHAGDKVVMFYGSANRDERIFADPNRFDIGRTPNEHIAFGGGGPHFCLGANLARIEVRVMLREILTRLPDIEASGPAEWLPSNFISGPRRLPVRFSPSLVGPA